METSYKASLEDEVIELPLSIKWVMAESITVVTEDKVRNFILNHSCRDTRENEAAHIGLLVGQIKMNYMLPTLEEQV